MLLLSDGVSMTTFTMNLYEAFLFSQLSEVLQKPSMTVGMIGAAPQYQGRPRQSWSRLPRPHPDSMSDLP